MVILGIQNPVRPPVKDICSGGRGAGGGGVYHPHTNRDRQHACLGELLFEMLAVTVAVSNS